MTIRSRELMQIGVPKGECKRIAVRAVKKAEQDGGAPDEIKAQVFAVVDNPEGHTTDYRFGELARAIIESREARSQYRERQQPAPYRRWGEDLDPQSIEQMENACRLPVSVSAALMPDCHVGYGLPIGGVLATRNAVIPYAVGVDIACRMKMTVLDLPPSTLQERPDRLKRAIEQETRFGIGASFKNRRDHRVLDEDWSFSKVLAEKRDKAWSQLGTSGSGNHFVEFGILTLDQPDLGLEAGAYLALLSHSGSRGTGATVADHYSKLAMAQHPELPPPLHHLAWLDLDAGAGQEYWQAMEAMGRYASANHELIHRYVARNLGAAVLLDVENHHNFAWKETHGGEELIVHRKGATPAGKGVLGIIPGSMAAPGYVIRGKGSEAALDSAAHGAGRVMSRKQAKKRFNWRDVRSFLENRGVELMSAGLDEVPFVYKDINEVMAQQAELVETVARFDPKLVKMAPAGERPED